MKKLTLWMVACLTTLAGFAAGGNITYVLGEGVANEYGWQNKADMLVAFSTDYNTVFGASTAWGAETKPGDINGNSYGKGMYKIFETETIKDKWLWLRDYILAVAEETSYKEAAIVEMKKGTAGDTYWRTSIDGFWTNTCCAAGAWNAGVDFSTGGGELEAFQPTWKHGFVGPAEYDGTVEVVLPKPYKEGDSFIGWYKEADFSGDRFFSIPAGTEGDLTLYARYGEYIPNCKEVAEMEVGTETKVGGTVSMVSGTQVWMQDTKAGLLVQFAEASTLKAGEEVVLSGKVATLGEYKILTEATIVSNVAAKLPTLQTVKLAELAAKEADYMFEYVKLEGLKVTDSDGAKLTVVDDGTNTLTVHVAKTFDVGELINIIGVVSFDEAVCVMANADDVNIAPKAGVDPFTYPARHDGRYSLTNKWIISQNMGNLSANPVADNSAARGMVAFDGKMYFIDKNKNQLTVVDGATGEKLSPVPLAAEVATGEKVGVLKLNDIKRDNAGHLLVGNMITSVNDAFEIWSVDVATGACERILRDDTLANRFPVVEGGEYADGVRLDAFGVYGDVKADGYIMAAQSWSSDEPKNNILRVFKWDIKGGKVTPPMAMYNGVIPLDSETPGTSLSNQTNAGSAPQVFPVNEEYFYLDGFNTSAALLNMDGTVFESFAANPSCLTDSVTKPGERYELNTQLNGIMDFEVNGEHFVVMASGATNGNPPSSFRLYKYANANKAFADLECLWTFPQMGMGSNSNGYRTAVPSVEVDEATRTATIYLYAGENGYGVYEFEAQEGSGVDELAGDAAVKAFADGSVIRMSEEVAQVSVFSMSGQLVATAAGVSAIDVANNGLYVVKMLTRAGEPVVQKVLVK